MKCPGCETRTLLRRSSASSAVRRWRAFAATVAAARRPRRLLPRMRSPSDGCCGQSRFVSPEAYTPQHLADKILTARAALEGERKQVTVLFADIKGSMEVFADRDPEAAQKLFDPVLERMIEAVHRYEGTVNQGHGRRNYGPFWRADRP